MKIWLLYPYTTPRSSNAFGWFREVFSRRGMELETYFWGDKSLKKSELYAEDGSVISLDRKVSGRGSLPEGAIIRGYNSGLSMWFEMKGIKVINPCKGMELCRDKILTSSLLEKKNIPTPRTLTYGEALDSAPEYSRLRQDFGGKPFVMKMTFGSKGEDVYLIENEKRYSEALQTWRLTAEKRIAEFQRRGGLWTDYGCWMEEVTHGCTLLFQEYIETSYGRDLRVWVVGDRVAGHLLRFSASSFKSNFAQGGSASPCPLPQEAGNLAIAATKALGLTFAGVDLLFGEHFSVCEVNGNAGFRTTSLVGGIDIPDQIAKEFRF